MSMIKLVKFIRRILCKLLGLKHEYIPIYQPVLDKSLLANKIVFITGGTGGIGRVIAQKAIEAGAKVIVAGTNEQKLKKLVLEFGDNIRAIRMDLSVYDDIVEKISEAVSAFPEKRIDILVNSAGLHGDWSFQRLSEKEFDKVIDVNIKGTYFITNFIAHHMIDNHIKGHILNVSSSSALRPAWTPYQISKWAIDGMTKGFADLLLKDGIIVNGIAPGPTATDMVNMGDTFNIYYDAQPSHRYAVPEEIANLAIYLISPLADFIVGDTIYITGGSGTISYHK